MRLRAPALCLLGLLAAPAAARPDPGDVLVDDDPGATCRSEHRALAARTATAPPTCWRSIRRTSDQIELLAPIRFATGKGTLHPSAMPILDEVAALLALHPALAVEIQGHYHDEPYRATRLSALRARAVHDYLVARGGIMPSRLRHRGHGEDVPRVWPARTDAARRRNWRIELHLVPPPPPAPPPP